MLNYKRRSGSLEQIDGMFHGHLKPARRIKVHLIRQFQYYSFALLSTDDEFMMSSLGDACWRFGPSEEVEETRLEGDSSSTVDGGCSEMIRA